MIVCDNQQLEAQMRVATQYKCHIRKKKIKQKTEPKGYAIHRIAEQQVAV